MFLLGLLLIIDGAVLSFPIVYSIGIILAIVGAVMWELGSMGRDIGGRQHHW